MTSLFYLKNHKIHTLGLRWGNEHAGKSTGSHGFFFMKINFVDTGFGDAVKNGFNQGARVVDYLNGNLLRVFNLEGESGIIVKRIGVVLIHLYAQVGLYELHKIIRRNYAHIFIQPVDTFMRSFRRMRTRRARVSGYSLQAGIGF